MNEPMSLLVIVVPESLEDPLVDELLLHPEWVSGFDTQAVEGHGSGRAQKSGAERVRGRARRVRVEMAITEPNARALLGHLKRVMPQQDVVYWMQGLAEFGRFA